MSWLVWIPIIIGKIPYIVTAFVELFEAGVCTANFVVKYSAGYVKGKFTECTDKENAVDKLKTEWSEAGTAFKKIFTEK